MAKAELIVSREALERLVKSVTASESPVIRVTVQDNMLTMRAEDGEWVSWAATITGRMK